jgi:uncharacterized membrane protein HdeD (DUF308 family)
MNPAWPPLPIDTVNVIVAFLQGAIMICAFLASLFFFRFWRQTKDRLFLYFATSFFTMGIVRICLTFTAEEDKTGLYFVRMFSFVLIIAAIVEKNRPRSSKPE